jgi:hypothetical protein
METTSQVTRLNPLHQFGIARVDPPTNQHEVNCRHLVCEQSRGSDEIAVILHRVVPSNQPYDYRFRSKLKFASQPSAGFSVRTELIDIQRVGNQLPSSRSVA